jgi:stearoyl-CoA desaturase (delta-9 desaturase)
MTTATLEPVPQAPPSGKLERRITLALTIGPLVGFLIAVRLFWAHGITGLDMGLMIALYLLTGLGVTVGYHRHFTHQSFEAGPRLRAVLAVAGSYAVQGSVISWVADHRRHHAFADKEGDPHSPHLEDVQGFMGVLRGLWHAHTGWLFRPASDRSPRERWAPDLLRDPAMVKIDRLFPAFTVGSFLLPGVIGLVATRSLWGGFTAIVWGGAVRVFVLHHVTWSINSICHFYGRRPYESKDLSTNNWPLSLLSFGESWHNNHHAFPTSAIHGIDRAQPDVSGFVIRTLERCKLVWNVKMVPTELRQLRRA